MGTPPAQATMPTTISVPEDLADELYERKQRGESYADVIYRLIEQADSGTETPHAGEGTDSVAPDKSPTPTPDATRAGQGDAPAPETFAEHVDDVAEQVLPGSGEKLEQRRAAFHAVIGYLREHGTVTPAEFRDEVYPTHPARYEDGKDPARSWWKNAMYPALRELSERTGEIARADHSGEWRWAGDGDEDAEDTGGVYDPLEEF